MAKFIVTENGIMIHSTKGKNDAFCTAGERAETKRNADIGTEIAIFKDGVKISHYVMIERMNLWNEKVKEWEYRLC